MTVDDDGLSDDEREGDEYDRWLEQHPDEVPGPESFGRFLESLTGRWHPPISPN